MDDLVDHSGYRPEAFVFIHAQHSAYELAQEKTQEEEAEENAKKSVLNSSCCHPNLS